MKQNLLVHEFFKALSDPTRMRIIQLLHAHQTLCVCDITAMLNQPQPTVSRHLNQLKTMGLLTSERRGTWIWYAINPQLADWCKTVIVALPQLAPTSA